MPCRALKLAMISSACLSKSEMGRPSSKNGSTGLGCWGAAAGAAVGATTGREGAKQLDS